MADDKKEDEHEEGGAEKQDFAVIPMKYITPIMLVLIVIGTVGKFIAPNLTAQLGPVILQPFSMILYAYGFIIMLMTMFGERKTGMQVFSSIVPMLILALIIPSIFGFNDAGIWGAIIFMMLAPFLGKLLRGSGRAGLTGVFEGKKSGKEKMKEELLNFEEGEKENEEVGDIKNIPEYATDIKEELESVIDIAENERATLGDATFNKIRVFHEKAHNLAHVLMMAKKSKIKKLKGQLKKGCINMQRYLKVIGPEVYSVYTHLPKDDPHKKGLEDLSKSLRKIRKKLSLIRNTLA